MSAAAGEPDAVPEIGAGDGAAGDGVAQGVGWEMADARGSAAGAGTTGVRFSGMSKGRPPCGTFHQFEQARGRSEFQKFLVGQAVWI
jgi:hypothetical protein